MTEQQAAFLAALETDPEDWTTRLIYASWLDENDQPEEADRQRKYQSAWEWLRAFEQRYDLWDGAIQAGHEHYFHGGDGDDAMEALWESETRQQFWDAWSVVTGQAVTQEQRNESFSCGC